MKHLLKDLLLELLLVVAGGLHETGRDVNRNREDIGAIVFCRYTIQRFKILQLKREYFQSICYEDEWVLRVIFAIFFIRCLFLTHKNIPEELPDYP